MPVDYFVVLIPIIVLLSAITATTVRRFRKPAAIVAALSAVLFVLIYFVPGWVLMLRANRGNSVSQYRLGVWYWTRCGYMWSDIPARDKWWLRAAEAGHPHAMAQVGWFSIYGSSSFIPRDHAKARYWLEAAKEAGDTDADEGLKMLAASEAKNQDSNQSTGPRAQP